VTKTEGILIRKSLLTETSLIVHWCTRELGLLKTVAKGARRPKSAFAGRLDLFYTAEIDIVRSRSSDLHILREVAVITHRFGLQQSYLRLLAASYFVKLLETVAERETPIPELYALLARALDYLESHQPDLRAVLHYEQEMARSLGIHALEGGAPIQAIREVYHHVPEQRATLLDRLRNDVE
jgi:DNA repair protein RecO (recombination protein O)